tara:strand:- start:258 stop:431 length:174 start_codon:yes stop_codon:yes gene_type:complete
MNLKNSPFSILDKERKEIEYIRDIYKKRVQNEIESYEELNEEDSKIKINSQDILMSG